MKTTPVSRFRWLLYELVVRDLTLRYRGSILGFAWTLLNPILFVGVYTLVFSVVLHNDIHNYPLFLLSGLVPWIWFSGAVTQGTTAVLDGRTYVGKTLMPTEILILTPVLSNGLNFLITVALLALVALVMGVNIVWALLFLPALIVIQLCLALGCAFLLATANVFYRDLQQLVSYLLMAGIFLTPIFYSRSSVPRNLMFLVTYNPLAHLIAAYQNVFYKGIPPDANDLIAAAVSAAAILTLGLLYFNSRRDSLGEEV